MARIYSIQGEQQATLDAELFMDQGEVDEFVDGLSPELRACREGRHDLPPTSLSQIEFARWNDDFGAFERHIECRRCGCYTRVELWQSFRRGGHTRWRKIGNASPRYHTNTRGETYTAPAGHGRISPRQIQEALATQMMAGVNPTQLRKDLEKAEKERRQRDDDKEGRQTA